MELSDEETERLSPAGDNPRYDRARGIGSDEAEEESKRRVDPSTSKKRIIKNPQPKLNIQRIRGPKGVQTIEKYFEGFKYRGKGREKNDLDRVMKRLEHWAHRLFPKYRFDDFIEKIELLGGKKNVQVYLKTYRLDMITADGDIVDATVQDDADQGREAIEKHPVDEFDKLIAEQIEKQRASEAMVTVGVAPKGHVSDSAGEIRSTELSDEIKARILANKKLALERKMARIGRPREEKNKRSVSPTIIDESQMPEFSSKETVEESKSANNKRQKLETSPEFGLARFADSRADPRKETDVEKYNGTENLESSQVPSSQELQNFQRVLETMEISAKTPEMEETRRRKEETSRAESEMESSAASAPRTEIALTRQQLLVAIDGAMEEIIGRKN